MSWGVYAASRTEKRMKAYLFLLALSVANVTSGAPYQRHRCL